MYSMLIYLFICEHGYFLEYKMLFNSIEFLLFLPITFFSYWFLFNKNIKLQNLFIVFVSYLFYGWWDKRFLILIAITSFFSWLSGIVI